MVQLHYDVIVIGGGILGASAAVRLAYNGLKVVVLDAASGLCLEASGKNAGGLSIQTVQAEMMPYALEAMEMWKGKREPFLFDLHYKQTGSLALAFNDEDADLLQSRMKKRIDRGAPIEFIPGDKVYDWEPEIGAKIKLAAFCHLDGHVDPLIAGSVFSCILKNLGADVRTLTRVNQINRSKGLYEVEAGGEIFKAKRILISTGAWVQSMLDHFGIHVDLTLRINQMTVTERVPWKLRHCITIAAGNLSIKQLDLGTVVIGGGWQGRGQLAPRQEEIDYDNLLGNLALASYVIPKIKTSRVVRMWTGFDIRNDTFTPFAGRLPGHQDAFLLGGVFCGFHIGICLGSLMGDVIAGKNPKIPLPPSAIAETII